ncbi:MAG TPA: M1 family metallopeptidase [Bacilli bacterium]
MNRKLKNLLEPRHMAFALLCITAVVVSLSLYSSSPQVETYISEPSAITAPQQSPNPANSPPKQVPFPLSQRLVEYHIQVALNAKDKQLQGAQTLTWTNPGKKPVTELYFHLYPNAFQSMKSTFVGESGGKLRGKPMPPNTFGSMQVHSIQTIQGDDLLPRMRFVQPDDGNKNDQTLLLVKLNQPVPPHGKVTLEMSFTVKLPFAFARMGYVDDFVMAGQWFPKLAVYEPAGIRGVKKEAWNLHQYHGNSEFYADFGIYNVQIQVPSDYIVAATGFPTTQPTERNGTKTYHFYADDVHDFAWAASPHFVYTEVPFSSKNIPGMKIKLYLDPRHEHLRNRYLYAAKKALARYSEWYGVYPYSTLSIVIPPDGGNGAGGMEYPTLVTGWAAAVKHPDEALERVIVHEIGHQFWYGMVASNEFEEAWLDEGLTSYAEDKVMESEYGIRANLPLESSYITSPAPLKQFSWNYDDYSQYSENVYTRAKLVLLGIEKQAGPDQMKRILKTYFQRYKFKHPDSHDFQQVVEEVTKKPWDDYFNQFVYGGLMVDYSVEGIRTKAIQHKGAKAFENKVTVRTHGGYASEVPILFHFTDGSSVRKKWKGNDPLIQYTLIHKSPLDWVAIDPQHSLILENKHNNNFIRTQVADTLKIRWNLGAVKFIEALLGWVAW